jgi:hypothetical protein
MATPTPASRSTPAAIPYPRDPFFSGREPEMARLESLLRVGALPAVVGGPGVGKTALIVEYIYRHAPAYPGGVFWLNMEHGETVPAQVAACGGPQSLDIHGWPDLTLEERVAAVLRVWEQETPRLLILDNLEDSLLLSEWRPRGGCRAIISTRRRSWGAHTGVQQIPLGPLDRGAAYSVLRGGVAASERDHDALDEVCAALGDVPLGLGGGWGGV